MKSSDIIKAAIDAVKSFGSFIIGDKPKLQEPLDQLDSERERQIAEDRRRDRKNRRHGSR